MHLKLMDIWKCCLHPLHISHLWYVAIFILRNMSNLQLIFSVLFETSSTWCNHTKAHLFWSSLSVSSFYLSFLRKGKHQTSMSGNVLTWHKYGIIRNQSIVVVQDLYPESNHPKRKPPVMYMFKMYYINRIFSEKYFCCLFSRAIPGQMTS